jgi:hypothetical protein
MSTGLIAAGNGVATILYTPTSNAKIRIAISTPTTSASLSINGVIAAQLGYTTNGPFSNQAFDVFAAASVPITFTTTANLYYTISSLEEAS